MFHDEIYHFSNFSVHSRISNFSTSKTPRYNATESVSTHQSTTRITTAKAHAVITYANHIILFDFFLDEDFLLVNMVAGIEINKVNCDNSKGGRLRTCVKVFEGTPSSDSGFTSELLVKHWKLDRGNILIQFKRFLQFQNAGIERWIVKFWV